MAILGGVIDEWVGLVGCGWVGVGGIRGDG